MKKYLTLAMPVWHTSQLINAIVCIFLCLPLAILLVHVALVGGLPVIPALTLCIHMVRLSGLRGFGGLLILLLLIPAVAAGCVQLMYYVHSGVYNAWAWVIGLPAIAGTFISALLYMPGHI